ncbi:MAG: hypothetical protein FWC64_06960 [Treponema sp.]|nr:hypothetical protein [Treponema sp.]
MSKKNKQQGEGKKCYIYKRCPPCGVKLHVQAYACFRCGNRAQDMTYGSQNPNDAIYNLLLNKVEKCFSCFNTQNGNPCKPIICFGSGRGKCGICKDFSSIRFNCCQEIQADEKILENARKDREEQRWVEEWWDNVIRGEKRAVAR